VTSPRSIKREVVIYSYDRDAELRGANLLFRMLRFVDDPEDAAGGVRSCAVDSDAAKRLWSVSEEMVGQSFPL
jgi:hypothetical protein